MNQRAAIDITDATGVGTHDEWMTQVWKAAPHIEPFAQVRLADALTAASTELLLIVRDAIAEAAADQRVAGEHLVARELGALAALITREAAWRSPTLGLPRPI